MVEREEDWGPGGGKGCKPKIFILKIKKKF